MAEPGFTGAGLDRADHLRLNEQELAALRLHAEARLLSLAELDPVLDEAGGLAWSALGEEIEPGPAKHLALEHLQVVDLPFNGALAPGQRHPGRRRTSRKRSLVEGRFEVQRVLRVASRMVGAHVQRFEAMPVVLGLGAIEDLDRPFDNVLCFNVLTNSPHYALPLERLLVAARRRIFLRESLHESLLVRYTPDPYLDDGKRHIRVYHNTYPIDEVTRFIEEHGFRVRRVVDRRTNDGVENVVDLPHHWRILVGEKT